MGTSPYGLETELDFTGPVIIIGPGRSGTTMLGAALGEHSDFYMIGETRFLIQRLWATFCEQKDYVNYRRLSCLAQQTRSEWSNLPWSTLATEVRNEKGSNAKASKTAACGVKGKPLNLTEPMSASLH